MRGTKAPTIVTVSPVTNPNRVAKASPAKPNWLPPMEPETREAPSNRRKASWSTPRTTTESPSRTLRPRISGLTVTVQLDADRFDARLTLIDRAPEPCVIAKASPATTRAGTLGRAARTGHVAPRRNAQRARPENALGRRSEEHTSELQSQSNLVC